MKKELQEKGNWLAKWTIEKFANNEAVKLGKSYEKIEIEKNILVNTGINALTTLLAAGGGTAFNNANAYLGVGDSTTAAAATQTDLQAATNKLRKAMNATFPTYGTSQKITFQSDFGADDANWAWAEMAVFNAAAAGTMLNRKVSAQGTKTAGQTWRLSLEITIS
ncbi:MAG TPA: hypothetical protein DDY21_00260 [Candidatus Moranbacteria bacterium]|nr:hypothetical protein [Candidatus Moranbacteria bacterium]